MIVRTAKFNYILFVTFFCGASVFYILILWLLGMLYEMIHPYVSVYAHAFWYVVMNYIVFASRFINLNDMTGDETGFIDEFLLGLMFAAMIAFPYHFALICESLNSNFDGNFSYIQLTYVDLGDWLGYAWFNSIEALFLDIPSIYGIAISEITPVSFIGKTITFIFRLSMGTLYILGGYNLYKHWRMVKSSMK